MRKTVVKNQKLQVRRALRVRKHLHGTAIRPRLCVVKSNKHIHAQLIDDDAGKTMGYVGTSAKEYRDTDFARKNKASARRLGSRIAEIAKHNNVKEVVFDRGPFKYHGILAELAEGARAGGLKF